MNTNKLITILQIQTTTYQQFRMFAYIIREIKSIQNCKLYVLNGNIYVTKGETHRYPCIVAHMDTVHEIAEDLVAVKFGPNLTGFNRVRMTQTGIGGDDKVGVYIALECLLFFDHIKIAFFRDEEVGCAGSCHADRTFFEDCNFVLQCDRKGRKDFIVEAGGVGLSSKSFQSKIRRLIKRYGYSFAKGMMTDVMALKQLGIECSMANISCGYYNPHWSNEFVNVNDVENCLNLVKAIIYELGDTLFPHTFKGASFQQTSYRGYDLFNVNEYCADCWSPDVTPTGYCQSCNAYYQLGIDGYQR
jgi:tripeptide aminopeptidase